MSLENKTNTSGIAVETQGSENTREGYVNWKGIDVKIPTKPYNAGGREADYTAKKVLSTLNFYHNMARADNLNEALREETEENHIHHLLNEALTHTVKEGLMAQDAYDWFIGVRKKFHKDRKDAREAKRAEEVQLVA